MTELVYKNNAGFGNLLIQLTSLQEECKQLHDHVFAYELSNCLTIDGFTRVSHEGKQPECPIYINQFTVNHVHPKIRDIIKPTPFMEELISKHKHLVEGVCCGISVVVVRTQKIRDSLILKNLKMRLIISVQMRD